MHIRPDGRQEFLAGHSADVSGAISPNGIALQADGSFLIAHLGADEGGVFTLSRNGQLVPRLREVDGAPLPPTNFVTIDPVGRLWVTVSTRIAPRIVDYRPSASTGFIVMDDGRGPRIVADGLGYANECRLSPDGAWLYVNETFTRRLSRFPLHHGALSRAGTPGPGTTLGPKEVVAEFGPGEFPDGLTFDTDGGIWVTCVVGDRVLRVDQSGRAAPWLLGGSPEHVAAAEQAYRAGTLGPEYLSDRDHSPLGGCSSLAFTGPDRRIAIMGSLFNDHLLWFNAPVKGIEPPHWQTVTMG